jgi:hypothetical protein
MDYLLVDSAERGRLEQALVNLQRHGRHVEENLGVWESVGECADVECLKKTKGARDRAIERALRPEELVGVYNTVRSLEASGVREPAEGDLPAQIAYQAKLWGEIGPCLRSLAVPAPISEEGLQEATRILINQGKKERSRAINCEDGVTCGQLRNIDIPQLKAVVPELLVTGLAIFASIPKIGKTWLCLQLGVAVASGGRFLGYDCGLAGQVLYLALEDGLRRMHVRLESIGASIEEGIDFFFSWPQGERGFDLLKKYLDDHPGVLLVVIDTLFKFLGLGKIGSYGIDYESMARLKQLGDEYEVAILVVHHLRKSAVADPVELMYGSNGLTGAADTLWVLSRGRGLAEANLLVTGRDVPETNLPLAFDHATGAWSLAAEEAPRADSAERQRILDAMADGTVKATGEIAAVVGKSLSNTNYHLNHLIQDRLIKRVGYGKWAMETIETECPRTDAESQQGGVA